MAIVRIWLPVSICVGAAVLLFAFGVTDSALEGAAYLLGAGLSVFLLNWLYRVSISGERDRDEEDAARDYFDRHGKWPDDS